MVTLKKTKLLNKTKQNKTLFIFQFTLFYFLFSILANFEPQQHRWFVNKATIHSVKQVKLLVLCLYTYFFFIIIIYFFEYLFPIYLAPFWQTHISRGKCPFLDLNFDCIFVEKSANRFIFAKAIISTPNQAVSITQIFITQIRRKQ